MPWAFFLGLLCVSYPFLIGFQPPVFRVAPFRLHTSNTTSFSVASHARTGTQVCISWALYDAKRTRKVTHAECSRGGPGQWLSVRVHTSGTSFSSFPLYEYAGMPGFRAFGVRGSTLAILMYLMPRASKIINYRVF